MTQRNFSCNKEPVQRRWGLYAYSSWALAHAAITFLQEKPQKGCTVAVLFRWEWRGGLTDQDWAMKSKPLKACKHSVPCTGTAGTCSTLSWWTPYATSHGPRWRRCVRGHKATDAELTYAPVSQAYGHRHKLQFNV